MTRSAQQLSLYEDTENKVDLSSTFAANLSLGVHRWFRYSAGFSAEWARETLLKAKEHGCKSVLDPFAGSGTTILEAQQLCLQSIGLEAHPLVQNVGLAKLAWDSDISIYVSSAEHILTAASSRRGSVDISAESKLISRIFTEESLKSLVALRTVFQEAELPRETRLLVWLTLCSILRECSTAGTAQWQYVLPNKSKARVTEPFAAFRKRAQVFAHDMSVRQLHSTCSPLADIRADDARTCSSVADESIDLVLTSPPYANNYDYADATRIEMTFFGEVQSWGDLQEAVRKHLLRSCSQHAVLVQSSIKDFVADEKIKSISGELSSRCAELSDIRLTKGGKKAYHALVAAYFFDMADVLISLRRVLRPGGCACFVIGDSAPYGVHIPVERWIGQLAIQSGFRSWRFEKTRDRNTKWKNRKHTVPLQEGRLWMEG